MLRPSRLAIFALFIILAACTTPQAAPPASPVQPEPVSTSTATSLPATLPPTPEKLPTATAEPTQTPGQTDIVYPIPKPLTGQAPWLMFACVDQETNSVPMIANGDGTGCVPFPLPGGIPGRSWISAASEHSSYVAFRVKISTETTSDQAAAAQPNAAYRLQPNGLDDHLWIVKLPENRIVRKIAQIDGGGWDRIQNLWQNPGSDGKNFVPVPLAVTLDPGAYHWSPDGRFLAYPAVDKDGVDLYVYDTRNDSIRRMSRGRQGAFFWSWSSNGKWIIYHDMARCRLEEGRCLLERGLHYYAVAFPQPEFQFEDNFPAGEVDWVADNRYILQDIPAQGQLSSRLVQVDLSTGVATTLYDESFYSYTYVPKTYVSRKEMYLLNLPADAANDRVTGIYTLYPPRQVDWLRPFLTGAYGEYTIQWEHTLEQFILSRDVTRDISTTLSGDPLIQKDVVLIPVALADPVSLGVLSTSRLDLSPDGAWFTTRLSSGNYALYTKQGKQVLDLGPSVPSIQNPVQWLKDSSVFYFVGYRQGCASSFGCIYRFVKEQAWKAAKTGEMKGAAGVLQVIEP